MHQVTGKNGKPLVSKQIEKERMKNAAKKLQAIYKVLVSD